MRDEATRRRLVERASAALDADFSADRMADDTAEVYDRVLAMSA